LVRLKVETVKPNTAAALVESSTHEAKQGPHSSTPEPEQVADLAEPSAHASKPAGHAKHAADVKAGRGK
jgi:hypothetical protein